MVLVIFGLIFCPPKSQTLRGQILSIVITTVSQQPWDSLQWTDTQDASH